MDLSAIIKAVLAPLESQPVGDLLKDLQPGDYLTGKVLSVQSDGRPVYTGQLIRLVHRPTCPGTRIVCLADHVHVDDVYGHLHSFVWPVGCTLR